MDEIRQNGIGVSPGAAVAGAFVYRPAALATPKWTIPEDAADAEWMRLMAAHDATRRQLQKILDSITLESAGGEGSIIEAHLMALDDEAFAEDLRAEIYGEHRNAEWAVGNVSTKYVKMLRASHNEYLSERAGDILDVARRVLRFLMGVGEANPFSFAGRRIVVAEDLTPSEALALPRDRVAGVALDRGSLTSHAALLVRAIGIPAVFGLGDFSKRVADGCTIAIDGNGGLAVASPNVGEEARFARIAAERAAFAEEVRARAAGKAVSPDGVEFSCLSNIEDEKGVEETLSSGGEGVGLFRTEYLWLAEGRPVDEERQIRSYAAAAKALGDRPLAIRAFDLGGDKFRGDASLGRREENPFLGMRSIRFLLDNEQLFRVQIRAVLRAGAAVGRPLDFTIPMVSDVNELVTARRLVEECFELLRAAGEPCVMPRIGAMVEVPSAALSARILAHRCDYFSLGTNDLTQYTLAVDRCNADTVRFYQPFHPAVLKLVKMSVDAAHDAKIGIAACGELAGTPLGAIVFAGLGVRTLSMAPAAIPLVKETVRRVPVAEAGRIAALAAEASTAAQIRHLARKILSRFAPEILRQC